jgi:KDO2-lipid IV(A) lauroyltransferase
MKNVLWFVECCLVVLFTLPVALLPHRLAMKAGEALGATVFFFWGSRRRIALDNLKEAVSRGALTVRRSPESIIKEHFILLGRSFVEVIKVAYGLGGHIIEKITIDGVSNYLSAHNKGAGVLVVTGHCGNWELNAVALSARVGCANIIARPLDNPYLNRLVERYRERRGHRMIYKRGAVRNVLAALRRNEVVAMLIDQSVVKSEGVVTEFLGRKCYTMKTPALLAMKTGAAVLPVFIRREGGHHRIEIGEEIVLDRGEGEDAVRRNTAKLSGYVEDYIRRNPAEWLWIHRRWKDVVED